MGVRAAAAPIPPPCNDSRCLERGVAGYCGSSPARSDTYLLLSGARLVGGVSLLLRSLPRSSITAGLSAELTLLPSPAPLLHVVAILSRRPLVV